MFFFKIKQYWAFQFQNNCDNLGHTQTYTQWTDSFTRTAKVVGRNKKREKREKRVRGEKYPSDLPMYLRSQDF